MNGNLVLIENAVVEEAVFYNGYSGYIIISQNGVTQRIKHKQKYVRNQRVGSVPQPVHIREGSLIDAVASSQTRSIPPQSAAYLIMVKEKRPETVRRISYG